MKIPDAYAEDFFDSCLIVPDWIKLPRNGDVVCFVLVRWSWDLTWDFAGVFLG